MNPHLERALERAKLTAEGPMDAPKLYAELRALIREVEMAHARGPYVAIGTRDGWTTVVSNGGE